MADTSDTKTSPNVATVAKVIDDYTVVINHGADKGVKTGDRFLIYFVEKEELLDPETGESLGHLELVRGTGTVTHVQAKLSTIESNRFEKNPRVKRRIRSPGEYLGGLASFLATETTEEVEETPSRMLPFESPRIGDKAKPI